MLTLLAVLGLSAQVFAGDHCCGACGCQNNCKKVCRLECGMKTVITYDWAVDCEDYCVPGIGGCKVGEQCLRDAQTRHGCRIEEIWKPNCCNKIRTRRTPVKIPIITQVPSYRCVVECVCCGCGHSDVDVQATAEMERLREQGLLPGLAEREQVTQTSAEEPVATVERTEAVAPSSSTGRATSGLLKLFMPGK
jgi:hypothetical protein